MAILHGDRPDHPPLFPEGIREEVLLAWRNQGLADGIDLDDLFFYDPFEQLDPDVYPNPEILDWSTPQQLLPLLRQRLDPGDPRRLPNDWNEWVKGSRDRQYPLFLRIHQGLFLSLGIDDWHSFAPAIMRLVDQPDYVHEILAIQADFAARLAEKILRQVDLDGVIFSEPVAGNHGALISAEMYRAFALQSYAPIFDVLCHYQVPAIIWRSYANPANLLREVVKYPFNVLWLCETPPGALTPVQVRQIVGSNLTLIGGIDSDVLREDQRAIQQAIAAVQPFVEEGRFIPLADGRAREDVPYPNYAFYRQELQKTFLKKRLMDSRP
ncbi:MAG: uroporphyrinogen decarboxylase family protein [Omnitrophica WOR_2 bacterium]